MRDGIDPGIDHMSAMQLIHRIKDSGGEIHSFLSHCGGLVAPESDTNPWHYKISWNPRNVVWRGKRAPFTGKKSKS
jgi:saccharopine dehydrogenase-like NADP-dependent oxidoreductase